GASLPGAPAPGPHGARAAARLLRPGVPVAEQPAHAVPLRLESDGYRLRRAGDAGRLPGHPRDGPLPRGRGVGAPRRALARPPARRLPRLPRRGAAARRVQGHPAPGRARSRGLRGRPRRRGGVAIRPAPRPLRSGERLMHHRYWMSREGYQDRTAVTLAAAVGGSRWLTTPGLAWTLLAVADPDRWEPHFAIIGFPRAPEADFEVGGRRFGVFAHDWRVESPLAWIERKGQLDPAVKPAPEPLDSRSRVPLVVLSQPDFEAAVRRALRDFTRPAGLATNPLLRSRVAAEHAGGVPTPATLQALLREAAATLRASPRDEKLYRAVRRTYLQPAATQELAAELLGLPFSTYR